MSTHLFKVQQHVLPGQHIRQYPRATANEQEDVLYIAIKQYIPLGNLDPKPGDVTILGAHANGFPKELYEPLWDEILERANAHGIQIRGIWIADVAHQGESGVINEEKLGNDPSWFDHPRDLLHMINHFRAEIPRPIVGIGHSMGGNNLVNLALMHPRLLSSLVLIEPVIKRLQTQGNFNPALASALRRDLWPSREAAAMAFRKSKFFQSWDPRVLELWIRHGLRDLPTSLYPENADKNALEAASTALNDVATVNEGLLINPESAAAERGVTLTTTKQQEVLTFVRPTFPPASSSNGSTEVDRITHPDLHPSIGPSTPFYRPEVTQTFSNLPYLRPPVLYIFGSESLFSAPSFRPDMLTTTGTGMGGSGGEVAGRVRGVVLEGAGHLVPMERVGETADTSVEWLAREIRRWRVEEEKEKNDWGRLSRTEKTVVSERLSEALKMASVPSGSPRKQRLEKL